MVSKMLPLLALLFLLPSPYSAARTKATTAASYNYEPPVLGTVDDPSGKCTGNFCPQPQPPAPCTGYGCPSTPRPCTGYGCPTTAQPCTGYGCPQPPVPCTGYGCPTIEPPCTGYGCPTTPRPCTGHGCPQPPAPCTGYGCPSTPRPCIGYGCPTTARPCTGFGCPTTPRPCTGFGCPTTPRPCTGRGCPSASRTARMMSQEPAVITAVVGFNTGNGGNGIRGFVELNQQDADSSVVITGTVFGLIPSKRVGIHIHESGDIREGCTSSRNHFNPSQATHGGPSDNNRHAGDLGNVVADSNGTANISLNSTGISLNGKNSIIGRMLVLHEKEDDFGKGGNSESALDGNSGMAMACGIVGIGTEM